MKRYGIFHPFLLSFFSRSLYRDVADHWKGVGFGYLFLLLAVAWIPAMVVLHRATARMVETFGPALAESFPTITITNGQVDIEAPEPYVLGMPGGGGGILAIVDTTGKISPEGNPALLFLTRNQLIVHKNERETRIYDLSMVKNFRLDQAFVERVLGFVKRYLIVAAYPCALICSFLYRMIQVLVYAGIGIVFARMSAVPLEYPQLLRLSSVAITPAVLLDLIRGLLSVPTSYLWWIFCLLHTLGYILFAVRASRSDGAAEAVA